MSVLLETTKGNIVFDLEYDKFPLQSYNFLKLCKINYYFFSPFFDLAPDKSVKCGNPHFPQDSSKGQAIGVFVDTTSFSKSFTGDVVSIETEKNAGSETEAIGTVKFVSEDDKVGSVFSISLGPATKKDAFATVAEGFSVLETLNNGEHVQLLHTHILHDPFDDPNKIEEAKKELRPTKAQLEYFNSREGGQTTFESMALELVGGLSDYKAQPSPSTLFVARLNPVTSEGALETFFGRFGQCKVSIFQGKKTLYAFVEFAEKQMAEKAYLGTSAGCIIDGNRVVVDFSESVRKSGSLFDM